MGPEMGSSCISPAIPHHRGISVSILISSYNASGMSERGSDDRTAPDDALIGHLAVQQNLIQPEQLQEAIRDQETARQNGQQLLLGQILVRRGWVGTEALARL